VFCENVFVMEGFLGLGRNTEALSAAAKARFVVCATGAGDNERRLLLGIVGYLGPLLHSPLTPLLHNDDPGQEKTAGKEEGVHGCRHV
jgi:hypothetical protein